MGYPTAPDIYQLLLLMLRLLNDAREEQDDLIDSLFTDIFGPERNIPICCCWVGELFLIQLLQFMNRYFHYLHYLYSVLQYHFNIIVVPFQKHHLSSYKPWFYTSYRHACTMVTFNVLICFDTDFASEISFNLINQTRRE